MSHNSIIWSLIIVESFDLVVSDFKLWKYFNNFTKDLEGKKQPNLYLYMAGILLFLS